MVKKFKAYFETLEGLSTEERRRVRVAPFPGPIAHAWAYIQDKLVDQDEMVKVLTEAGLVVKGFHFPEYFHKL